MFIEHDDKIVNTEAVTNIVIEGSKIIFNLDYGVSLQNDVDRIIPDYVYMVIRNEEDFNDIKAKIDSLNWIKSEFGNFDNHGNYRNNNRIVNPKAISFLKFDDRKSRIIFNLRNSVSFNRDFSQKTSDFVYFDHTEVNDYESERTRVISILGGM